MDMSEALIENKNFCLTIDQQRLPFFTFIKRKSLMFHYIDNDNSVYQWSFFWGINIVQKFSCVKDKGEMYKHTIQYAFELKGVMKIFSSIIEIVARKWMEKTWEEDKVLKERYYKFLNHGFKNMQGLTKNAEDRYLKDNKLDVKIPPPRIKGDITSHPFYFRNISKIFD